MSKHTFVASSALDASAAEVFGWHIRPGALERLTPPWERVEVVRTDGPPRERSRVTLRMGAWPLRFEWVAEHRGIVDGREFSDVQVRGPFRHWEHRHRFVPLEDGGSTLEDRIEFALPFGALGGALGGAAVRRRLNRGFAYRHAVTAGDLERHRLSPRPLHVAVSGAGGLVGAALTAFLTSGGHRVTRLVRRRDPAPDEIAWDPAGGRIEADKLEGLDAVVHLAGENIAAGRWTAELKRRIRDSRVDGTRVVARALASLSRPPAVLVNASAIGFYGDRGDEVLDESSEPGRGFLADTCRDWEAATEPAERAGLRVVRLRIGVVQTPAGGALAKMLTPFLLGAGGKMGHGRQFVSWIGLDDLVGALHFCLVEPALAGPVNAVAPESARNAEVARTLGRVLRRPAVVPLPGAAVRLGLGEMGRDLLLASTRVVPRALEAAGFRFRHPRLEDALRFELGRPQR